LLIWVYLAQELQFMQIKASIKRIRVGFRSYTLDPTLLEVVIGFIQ
jgi:hypothetical protein